MLALSNCAGISLGRVEATVFVYRPESEFGPQLVASITGARTTPAVVALASNGEWLTGEAARAQSAKNSTGTATHLLELLGRKHSHPEVARWAQAHECAVQEDSVTGSAVLNLQASGGEAQQRSPEALVAMLLKHLKTLVEEFVGGNMGPAVITVPPNFTAEQRDATFAAGAQAGIHILQVINEPTAVALAHGLDSDPNEGADGADAADGNTSPGPKTAVVIDMGGTQLAVSVFKCDAGILTLQATHKDPGLGALEFVGKIMQHCATHFKRKNGADPTESRRAMAKLQAVCDGAMRSLSTMQQTDVEVDSFYEGCDLSLRLSRARFEDLCGPLIRRIEPTIKSALSDLGLTPDGVETVLLAGGGAKMPCVQAVLRSVFGQERLREITASPDEVSALGAAAQASFLAFNSNGQSAISKSGKKVKYPRAEALAQTVGDGDIRFLHQ